MNTMNKIFASLEDLDETVDNTEFELDEDVTLDAYMMTVMEDEKEFTEEVGSTEEDDDLLEKVESSVERLEVLAEVITKYGISRSMMEVADPHSELVALGLCPAYEELEDIPVNDETAEKAAEGIKETAANIGKKIAKHAGKVGDAVSVAAGAASAAAAKKAEAAIKGATIASDKVRKAAGMVGSVFGKNAKNLPAISGGSITGLSAMGFLAVTAIILASAALIKIALIVRKMFKTYKTFLVTADKKLADITSFDEAKFGDMSSSIISKTDFKRGIKAGQHVIKSINADTLMKLADEMDAVVASSSPSADKVSAVSKKVNAFLKSLAADKDVVDMFGITIGSGDEGMSVTIKNPAIKAEKSEMSAAGWKAADAASVVKEAMAMTDATEAIDKNIIKSVEACKKIVATLKKQTAAGADAADKAALKQAVSGVKAIVGANRAIIKATVSGIYKMNHTAVRVANAAIKSAE